MVSLCIDGHKFESEHFVNAKGKRLYPAKVPSLSLPMHSISLRSNRRKPPRYPSVSLGDELATSVITLPFTHGTSVFPEVPEVVSPSPPTSPGLLPKRKWEVGNQGKTRDLRGSAGGQKLAPRANCSWQLWQAHCPDLQTDILEAFFSCCSSFGCCLVKVMMEFHPDTNVCPLHWQNVCYKFVCDNSAGGLFS